VNTTPYPLQLRVSATPAAQRLIRELKALHGPLMFHLSGGCCDGSAPMCFPAGEFRIGSVDEKVGEIAGCEFWMDREQSRRWAHTSWTVDVVPGRGASFSIEAPHNVRFLIRSSLCPPRPVPDTEAP
jgi:uncharacterized protein